MKCQNCGVENPEKNKFCMNCGTTIVKVPSNNNVHIDKQVSSSNKKKSNSIVIIVVLVTFALIICSTFLVFSIVKNNTHKYNNSETKIYTGYKKVGNSKVGYIYVPSDWKEDEMPSGYDDIEMVSYSDTSEKNGVVLTREPISEMDIPTDKDALWEDLSSYGATNIEVKNVTISGYKAIQATYYDPNLELYEGYIIFKDNNYGYIIMVSGQDATTVKDVIKTYLLN